MRAIFKRLNYALAIIRRNRFAVALLARRAPVNRSQIILTESGSPLLMESGEVLTTE